MCKVKDTKEHVLHAISDTKFKKKKKKERQNFSERKISGCWGQGQSRGWMQENHFKKVGETFLGDGNIQWYDCGGDYTAI